MVPVTTPPIVEFAVHFTGFHLSERVSELREFRALSGGEQDGQNEKACTEGNFHRNSA